VAPKDKLAMSALPFLHWPGTRWRGGGGDRCCNTSAQIYLHLAEEREPVGHGAASYVTCLVSGMASPPTPTDQGDEKGWGVTRKGIMANIFPLRQRFAKGIRQIAEVTADHVSRSPPPPISPQAHSAQFFCY